MRKPFIHPKSALWRDDRLTTYGRLTQLSDAAFDNIASACVQLNFFAQFDVSTEGAARVAFSALRVAIEHAAVGLWLLHPNRAERIRRLLMLEAKDAYDFGTLAGTFKRWDPEFPFKSAKEITNSATVNLKAITAAVTEALPAFCFDECRRFNIEETVIDADRIWHPKSFPSATWVWKTCSGLAHNRPYAIEALYLSPARSLTSAPPSPDATHTLELMGRVAARLTTFSSERLTMMGLSTAVGRPEGADLAIKLDPRHE